MHSWYLTDEKRLTSRQAMDKNTFNVGILQNGVSNHLLWFHFIGWGSRRRSCFGLSLNRRSLWLGHTIRRGGWGRRNMLLLNICTERPDDQLGQLRLFWGRDWIAYLTWQQQTLQLFQMEGNRTSSALSIILPTVVVLLQILAQLTNANDEGAEYIFLWECILILFHVFKLFQSICLSSLRISTSQEQELQFCILLSQSFGLHSESSSESFHTSDSIISNFSLFRFLQLRAISRFFSRRCCFLRSVVDMVSELYTLASEPFGITVEDAMDE